MRKTLADDICKGFSCRYRVNAVYRRAISKCLITMARTEKAVVVVLQYTGQRNGPFPISGVLFFAVYLYLLGKDASRKILQKILSCRQGGVDL